jgi:hypothetical protein
MFAAVQMLSPGVFYVASRANFDVLFSFNACLLFAVRIFPFTLAGVKLTYQMRAIHMWR